MLVTTLDDEQVAVLDAGDELHTLETCLFVDGLGEFFVQILYQHIAVGGFKVSPVMGDDPAVFHRDDVTAQRQVVVAHLIADAGGFKRSTTLIDTRQVVAEDGRIGHL